MRTRRAGDDTSRLLDSVLRVLDAVPVVALDARRFVPCPERGWPQQPPEGIDGQPLATLAIAVVIESALEECCPR